MSPWSANLQRPILQERKLGKKSRFGVMWCRVVLPSARTPLICLAQHCMSRPWPVRPSASIETWVRPHLDPPMTARICHVRLVVSRVAGPPFCAIDWSVDKSLGAKEAGSLGMTAHSLGTLKDAAPRSHFMEYPWMLDFCDCKIPNKKCTIPKP